MKAFFAYALLVIGVPVFIGMAAGSLVSLPISWLLRSKTSSGMTTNLLLLESVNGFMASLAGAFLFRLFGLTAGLAVPIITAAWITFYFFSYHQAKLGWVSWLVGLFLGWFTVAGMILAR